MDKYVRGTLSAGEESEPAKPIEPFDLRPFQPAGPCDADMGPRWQHLGGVYRGRLVHRDDTKRLIALRPLHAFAYQSRTLICGLIAIAAEHRHMKEYIRPAIIGNDKAIAL